MTGPVGQDFRRASGGLIDRGRPLAFTFDGKSFGGFAGDTLASALVANGVRVLGRSFKYHRPRGLLSAGVEEPNALVELRTGARLEPNTRATGIELYQGLVAASQNRWPSLDLDLLSLNGLLSRLFIAGFYYKTFMWPAAFWEKLYEPIIRRAAGLGHAPRAEDPDTYERAFLHCDVLVIGAGPAGLMSALAAGRSGARVVLCEEDFALGGRLLSETEVVGGRAGAAWASEVERELRALPEVTVLDRTSVFGVYDGGTYGAIERVADRSPTPPLGLPRQRYWRIAAKRAVLASGAIERGMIFGDNDRPGVMLGGAVRAYVNRFAALPGRDAAILASNDDGERTARDLSTVGIRVRALIDTRPERDRPRGKSEWRTIPGARVRRVHAGRRGIEALTVTDGSGTETVHACDLLALSNGWNPSLHLTCHLGGKPEWDERIEAFVPKALPPGMTVVGAAGGRMSTTDALTDGARLGAIAASDLGFTVRAPEIPKAESEKPTGKTLWLMADSVGKAFVDFQHDVTDQDIRIAHDEGYRSVEHLKRYTTLGMATDQGKTSNVPAIAVLAQASGQTVAEAGTTTFRPPFASVAIGALAGLHRGKRYRPTRLAPAHDWAKRQGAVFVEAGQWLRPQWFPKPGEGDWTRSVAREVRTVRERVGFCDVSTLGKIDLQGADTAEFLDRVYINTFSSLAVGKARYGVMLREDGFVLDDGTTARLGERHFVMTTTTTNAARVLQHLEFCHQCLWPKLDVHMVSVTERWSQIAVAGPKSRDVLARLADDPSHVSDDALPYLGARALSIGGGVAARIFRISYSGERAFEISVPADSAEAAAEALMQAGADFGIEPFGTEAMAVMRIEKGHIAGAEINGQTTARDLGLARLMSTRKDFVGRILAARPALLDPDRPSLSGFKPTDPARRLRAGAHFVGLGRPATTAHDEGHMTSVAFSPSLGHWIGLGLIRQGGDRIGERVTAHDPVRGESYEVEICRPCFLDPEGARLHG